jgi:hypothetical protein
VRRGRGQAGCPASGARASSVSRWSPVLCPSPRLSALSPPLSPPFPVFIAVPPPPCPSRRGPGSRRSWSARCSGSLTARRTRRWTASGRPWAPPAAWRWVSTARRTLQDLPGSGVPLWGSEGEGEGRGRRRPLSLDAAVRPPRCWAGLLMPSLPLLGLGEPPGMGTLVGPGDLLVACG